MLEPFDLPFVQRSLIMLCALALPAGLLGVWITLRGLTFFSHAIATATFPGLVLAAGLGLSPMLGGLAAAGAFAVGTGSQRRSGPSGADTRTALALVAFLALGVILASDVFASGASVDQALFGSVFLIGPAEIAAAIAVAIAVLAATLALGSRWLAAGFDPKQADQLRSGGRGLELALLGLVALVAVTMLPALGALLTGALLIAPAATARLFTNRLWTWQVAAVALTLAEGVVGLRLSLALDAPAGPVIAVLAAAVFLAVALGRAAAGLGATATPSSS